jgi:SAM-dependent methyltransferase
MIAANAHYNEKLASVYEQMYPIDFDTTAAVDFLSSLAPVPASVLELGVGTGRIAVPLAARGYEVHGIDGSEAMLGKLRERDPEGTVTAMLGDFTSTGTDRTFDVITLVLNTFYVAVTKEQQLGCLRKVREQLAPGGRFVLDAFDPSPYHTMQKPEASIRYLNEGAVMLDSITVDRARQLMVATHTIVDGGPPETTHHVIRYAFPLEIDLLAELSGLRLVDRYDGWSKGPYTSASVRHVSVYERADES